MTDRRTSQQSIVFLPLDYTCTTAVTSAFKYPGKKFCFEKRQKNDGLLRGPSVHQYLALRPLTNLFITTFQIKMPPLSIDRAIFIFVLFCSIFTSSLHGFFMSGEVRRHELTMHIRREQVCGQCQICDQNFTDLEAFKEHVRKHGGGKHQYFHTLPF